MLNNLVSLTYQRASFRGVPFLFVSNDQTGGRKYKIFEYPNRNERFTEDLGKLQRTYKMTATISDSTPLYKISKQRLIDALEKPGRGTLVHPTDGIKQVFALPYRINESITHVGTAQFELTFVESGDQQFPNANPSNFSVILQQLETFIGLVETDIQTYWFASSSFQGNIEYSADIISGLVTLFQNASELVTDNVSAFNEYIKSLNTLNENQFSYPMDPTNYGNNVQSLFNFGGQLATNSLDRLTIFQSFFGYSIDSFESLTVGTDEREKNRLITIQLINAQALVYYYLFLANTSFDTEDQIEVQHKLINDQFGLVVENNTFTDISGNSFPVLSSDTLSLLETLRFNAHQSLNKQLATARRIETILVKNDSLLSIVFSYYGDLELYDTIYTLNNLIKADNLSGELKVLSNEN